jgi:hypothetical protein
MLIGIDSTRFFIALFSASAIRSVVIANAVCGSSESLRGHADIYASPDGAAISRLCFLVLCLCFNFFHLFVIHIESCD